jgi:mutator protein MutT
MARLAEHYHDSHAPEANSIRPTAVAAARDDAGRLLLCRRADTLNWELPGGKVEIGETAEEAVVREVAEETGVRIEVVGFQGVYSDPGHVMVYATGEVRQQFAVVFRARPLGGRPRGDAVETIEAGWFAREEVDGLAIHPSMRLRVGHALATEAQVHWH